MTTTLFLAYKYRMCFNWSRVRVDLFLCQRSNSNFGHMIARYWVGESGALCYRGKLIQRLYFCECSWYGANITAHAVFRLACPRQCVIRLVVGRCVAPGVLGQVVTAKVFFVLQYIGGNFKRTICFKIPKLCAWKSLNIFSTCVSH